MQEKRKIVFLLMLLMILLPEKQVSANRTVREGITIRAVDKDEIGEADGNVETEKISEKTTETVKETERRDTKQEASEKAGSFAWFKKKVFPVISVLLVLGICAAGILTVYDQKNAEKRKKEKEKDRGKKLILKDKKTNHSYTAVLYKKLTIGRNMEQCDLWISGDYTISGKHCRMVLTDGKIYVEDAGSSNGTMLNNQKVTGQMEVHNGDTLKIGMTTFLIGFTE